MAIKKYFIDNEMYGVEAMNKIVAGLRTTGVDGEEAGGLLVSKNGELTVNIAPGRGWVDGCQIELDATESRAVGSAAGTYSVIMQLSKTGEQTDDIDIAVQEGSVTGAHVLAHVTVSAGQVTEISDVRTFSRAVGNTTIPVSIYSGSMSISETLAGNGTVTKVVSVPSGTVKVNGFILGGAGKTVVHERDFMEFSVGQGLNFLRGSDYRSTNYTPVFPPALILGTSTTGGDYISDEFSLGATGSEYIKVASMELSTAGLAITFVNTRSALLSINCTVAWEAWNYDTIQN